MEAARFSIHQEDPSSPQEETPSQQEEPSIQQEGQTQTGEVVSKEQSGDVQVRTTREGEQEQVQKGGKEDGRREGSKKKRGAKKQTITLGGLHRVQKAKKRKERQRVRRTLGENQIQVHEGWKRQRGPLPPTRSVVFIDNTAGGELARRFQEAENEAGSVTG